MKTLAADIGEKEETRTARRAFEAVDVPGQYCEPEPDAERGQTELRQRERYHSACMDIRLFLVDVYVDVVVDADQTRPQQIEQNYDLCSESAFVAEGYYQESNKRC